MNALTAYHPDQADAAPRALPSDVEAEWQVLSMALRKPSLVEVVGDQLQPHHFSLMVHVEIWNLIAEASSAGRTMTPPAIHARLKETPEYVEAGGSEYLMRVVDAAAMLLPSAMEDYAARVIDMWVRRVTITKMDEVREYLFATTEPDPASAHIEALETELAVITNSAVSEDRTQTYSTAIDTALAHIQAAFHADGKLMGVTTGLRDLDAKLGGLHKTDLLILAGRPSMGKSAMAWNMAEAAAKSGEVVAFYSLEMSADQLAGRGIAARSGIDVHRLREGRFSAAEGQLAAQAGAELKSLPIFIDDTAGLSPSQIRTRARRIKRKHGKLGLIIIDYLQLMSASATFGRGQENRTQEVSAITRALKAIAKELEVPVLALSQLSRACETREDKRPMLSDLRESGSIEQDADAVIFVYRDQYYIEKSEPGRRGDESEEKFQARYANWEANLEKVTNLAEAIIAKQRHGSCGTVKLYFDGRLTKFGDLETHHGQN